MKCRFCGKTLHGNAAFEEVTPDGVLKVTCQKCGNVFERLFRAEGMSETAALAEAEELLTEWLDGHRWQWSGVIGCEDQLCLRVESFLKRAAGRESGEPRSNTPGAGEGPQPPREPRESGPELPPLGAAAKSPARRHPETEDGCGS